LLSTSKSEFTISQLPTTVGQCARTHRTHRARLPLPTRALAARLHTHARTRQCIGTHARTQLSQVSTDSSWVVRPPWSRAHAAPPRPRTRHNTCATHSSTCARTTLAHRAPCLRTARTRCLLYTTRSSRPNATPRSASNACAPPVPWVTRAQHTTAPRGMTAFAQRQRHALRVHVRSRCAPIKAALRPCLRTHSTSAAHHAHAPHHRVTLARIVLARATDARIAFGLRSPDRVAQLSTWASRTILFSPTHHPKETV
jgi:hypothetical protein